MAEQKFGVLNGAQKVTLQHLQGEARKDLRETYGTGYPHYKGGSGLHPYHNNNHGGFVGDGTKKECIKADLSPDIREVGYYGGVRHDVFQGPGHEALGAALVEDELRRGGMPEWAAVMASLAIEGTGVIMKNRIIIAQKASLQEYPSKEAETMALGMASADMGVLFQPMGPLCMHDFYRETVGEAEPTIGKHFYDFKKDQLCMLETYKYPSPRGEEIFATHKREVMAYHQDMQGRVESGEIHTWAQLRASDLVFAQSLA